METESIENWVIYFDSQPIHRSESWEESSEWWVRNVPVWDMSRYEMKLHAK